MAFGILSFKDDHWRHPSEIGWAPGTLCCHACTGTNISKETSRTKNNCMHVQLRQIMDHKGQKGHNPRATSKCQEQRQGILHSMCMIPAHGTTKGVGRPPKPPLWPHPPSIPTLTSFKGPAHPSLGSQQGNLFLALTLLGCSTNNCLNSLSGPHQFLLIKEGVQGPRWGTILPGLSCVHLDQRI